MGVFKQHLNLDKFLTKKKKQAVTECMITGPNLGKSVKMALKN